MEKTYDKFLNWGTDALVSLFNVAVLIIVGFKIIKFLIKYLKKFLEKKEVDVSISYFIVNFCNLALKTIIIITAVAILGLPVTSLVALLGSFGIAIGLAIQGGLSNIVGGITILLLKPFKKDDYISFNDIEGTVNEISVFYTILNTFDNKRVVIPNGQLANATLTNYSANEERRVDLEFKISKSSSVKKVKKIIEDIVSKEELILKDRNNIIKLSKVEDSYLNIVVKVWTNNKNYWDVYFNLQEEVKLGLDKAEINLPHQQLDIHIIK